MRAGERRPQTVMGRIRMSGPRDGLDAASAFDAAAALARSGPSTTAGDEDAPASSSVGDRGACMGAVAEGGGAWAVGDSPGQRGSVLSFFGGGLVRQAKAS